MAKRLPLENGLCAQVACLLEASARKAGNVHPFAEFRDLRYFDFVLSATAIGPIFANAQSLSVGELVLRAVEATRKVVATNTNLGMILLLAPLAKAACHSMDPLTAPHATMVSPSSKGGKSLRGDDDRLWGDSFPSPAIDKILAGLTIDDARLVYRAIRLASPGGMGKAPEQDLADEPTINLREAMALAADRDLVARQYANGFRDVFDFGVPALCSAIEKYGGIEPAIVHNHLTWLAAFPDSLIARKAGIDVANEASRRAHEVLAGDWPSTPAGREKFQAFDAWFRADGKRRNPGTAADLTAACIFVALRDNMMTVPDSMPWLGSVGP